MTMTFNPTNPIIQLCIKGMALEESGSLDDAMNTFMKAWEQSSDDYERFISAYHVGLRQKSATDQLKWLQQSLDFALKIDDENVRSAYPTLYLKMANCYERLNDSEKAKGNVDLANAYQGKLTDAGPFYHGTKADLKVGELLTAGGESNYKEGFTMNHIYFTANIHGAGLAATLAKGEGSERMYIVEPTGEFEHDPNVTDKRFPGHLTRSYRSQLPLKIVGEETGWAKLNQSNRQEWNTKLAHNKGEIIN